MDAKKQVEEQIIGPIVCYQEEVLKLRYSMK